MKYYLAVDIGASSGRHIVSWMAQGRMKTEEVYRFPNGVENMDGHLTWDLDALVRNVREGIRAAVSKYPRIESLSIDTWGVDYVLMRGDAPVLPCYAYRDRRTEDVIEEVHQKISFETLYEHTGIQHQPFNTIYQLYDDKKKGRLEGVTDFLMIPEFLLWSLCGVKSHEYTNATTGGLVNAVTREYDPEIIAALGLPAHLFHPLQQPGTVLGEYEGIRCVLCPTHDTASAVEGIPMEQDAPYISSGTWSLLGVKTPCALTDERSRWANFSNEGGVGYVRYQKNIMGMWVVNRLRDILCPDMMFEDIVKMAEQSTFEALVDVNHPDFLAPDDMKEAFDFHLSEKAVSSGDYFRCAYRSLAVSYRDTLREMEENTGRTYDRLYIVGGGAKNGFLNQLTEDIASIKVIALPIEATALGNLKAQMNIVYEEESTC